MIHAPEASLFKPLKIAGFNWSRRESLSPEDALKAHEVWRKFAAQDQGPCVGFAMGSAEPILALGSTKPGVKVRVGIRAPEPELFSFSPLAGWILEGGSRSLDMVVPAGEECGAPLHLRDLVYGKGDGFYSGVRLRVGRGASLRVIRESLGGGASTPLCRKWLDLHLEAGAKLHWSDIQNLHQGADPFEIRRIILEEGAELRWADLQVGASTVHVHSKVSLIGARAKVRWLAASQVSDAQQHQIKTEIHHSAPQTTSELSQWNVATGEGRVLMDAKIVIPEGVTGCEADQRLKSLLLSQVAEIYATPTLEIFNDQVKCAHGCTVTGLDPEQLYYLGTRGISLSEARQRLALGFVEPVVAEARRSGTLGQALSRAKRSLRGKLQ